MTRTLVTGNGAAAWAARLARADYVPAFPITPQTEIIETIGRWADAGEMDCRVVTVDSEHSMLTAAGAAAATGVRVFTATSSQGLLYAMEMIFTTAGWRAPFVMVNVSRGVAAPLTLEPDHNDVFAARDAGFLQIHCATAQEVLDSTLIAFRLAEDARVRLPVIVNMDGFYLSFTREPVELPDPAQVERFLPPFDSGPIRFRASKPLSEAVAVLGGVPYSYFRYEMHLAIENALGVFAEISDAFSREFGRTYEAVEAYRLDDADFAFVMMGCFATKAHDAVDRLRATGIRIGLLRPRLFRPFPEAEIRRHLAGKKAVAVIDQNISLGRGGILHGEVAAALYGAAGAPPVVASFVGGLGGRDIFAEEFYEIAHVLAGAAATGEVPKPRLLYTETELREVRKLQAIAEVERHGTALEPPEGQP